ncbi:MAG: hypothetical protein WDO24_23605 [Pseudomonadota bacterium]
MLVLPGIDYDTAGLAARGDLILNLISDADVSRRVLPDAARLVDRIGRPTINHPAKIEGTDRRRSHGASPAWPDAGYRRPCAERAMR